MKINKIISILILLTLSLSTFGNANAELSKREIKERALKPHILYKNKNIKEIKYEAKFKNYYAEIKIPTSTPAKSYLYFLNMPTKDTYKEMMNKKTFGGVKNLANILDKKNPADRIPNRERTIDSYEFKVYNGNLREGKNYLSVCTTISNIAHYRLECTPPKEVIKLTKKKEGEKVGKIVTITEYNNYYNNQNQSSLQRMERYRSQFDRLKVVRAYNKDYLKIKNHIELEKYALGLYLKDRRASKAMYQRIGGKLYTFDQNKNALSSSDYQDYMVIYLGEYEKKIKDKKDKVVKDKENYKEEAVGNYAELKEQILHNKKSRKKALEFSKGLLRVLEQYNTTEKKIARLDKIDEYIRTKLTPEKFKDQVLISYVLDYMSIVRYSLELQ